MTKRVRKTLSDLSFNDSAWFREHPDRSTLIRETTDLERREFGDTALFVMIKRGSEHKACCMPLMPGDLGKLWDYLERTENEGAEGDET